MSDSKTFILIENDEPYLHSIAAKLKLPLVDKPEELPADAGFYLSLNDNILCLTNLAAEEKTIINVNFSSGSSIHRRVYGGGKKQALGKAIGLNKKANPYVNKQENPYVLDATAGLGKDAFVMASLGCSVKMVERSAIVGALLQDGLTRGLDDSDIAKLVKNMSLKVADSIEYMQSDSLLLDPPDVVYLDPMYTERKKSGKVKKEMQTLQLLLGHGDDLGSLLDAALACATKRVVVKRPKGAGPLSSRASTHSIESKKTRYDIYMSF